MKTASLRKIGNSQGIILDKTILDLTNSASPNTIFKISIDGDNIILTPLSDKDIKKAALEASKRISKAQRNVLDKLSK